MNLEQSIVQVPIEDIIPNRFQPRLTFDDRGLEELASSIKQHGIIQPLVLRKVEDKYEIIAGERRYKAARLAGLAKVPAVIANIDDNKSAEVAIVENVQRRDLTPIEEARSYKNLLDKGYLTQSELAKKMGLSQSAIANKLRLLNLDEEVQNALLRNQISERHARSLLMLNSHEEQQKWLNKIINERLTVRELDAALKKALASNDSDAEEDIPLVKSIDLEEMQKEAHELPNLDAESDIARKLREIEQQTRFNPDIVRVDQATNNSKGNFFNFLENETVNMNTEETKLNAPVLNFDIPKKAQAEEDLTHNEDLLNNFSNNFGETRDVLSEKSVGEEEFDPVNLIDTLDPEYEKKQEVKLGLDLKTAINKIRDTKDTLADKGFNISLEESDLENSYQFIIKIKKD